MSEEPKPDCQCEPARSRGFKCCSALHPKAYACTRREGHDGDHIACGGLCERYATWPQSDNEGRFEP